MESVGPWWSLPWRWGEQGFLISVLGDLHLLKGLCQVECANVASLLWFKNSHQGKGKNSHFPFSKKIKVPSPPGKKKIWIKNHQFIRVLDTAYTACNFQFFPWLPVRTPILSLPPYKAKSSRENWQKELICSSFSRYAYNWVRLLGSGGDLERGRGTIKLHWKKLGVGGKKAAT